MTALTISAVMIAAKTPAKSSASSERTRQTAPQRVHAQQERERRRALAPDVRRREAISGRERASTCSAAAWCSCQASDASVSRQRGSLSQVLEFLAAYGASDRASARPRPRDGAMDAPAPVSASTPDSSSVRRSPSRSVDLRLPAEDLAGEGDVGLADLRVVLGKCLVHDLRARPGDVDRRRGPARAG